MIGEVGIILGGGWTLEQLLIIGRVGGGGGLDGAEKIV